MPSPLDSLKSLFSSDLNIPDVTPLQNDADRYLRQPPVSPVVDRAWGKLKKMMNPSETYGVQVRELPYLHPDAMDSVAGLTPAHPSYRGRTYIDPSVSMTYPEKDVMKVLAHELDHASRSKGSYPDAVDNFYKAIAEKSIPYEERPSEVMANTTADSIGEYIPPELGKTAIPFLKLLADTLNKPQLVPKKKKVR